MNQIISQTLSIIFTRNEDKVSRFYRLFSTIELEFQRLHLLITTRSSLKALKMENILLTYLVFYVNTMFYVPQIIFLLRTMNISIEAL